MKHHFTFDREICASGLIGTDEAGCGPLAGPVFAAAARLDPEQWRRFPGMDDSKKLTEAKRTELAGQIRERALDFAVAHVTHEEVDALNIHRASLLAKERAVAQLKMPWDFLVVDGRFILPNFDSQKQRAIVKGDAKSACIAAASILAKVARDEVMLEYDSMYPEYGFAAHKGYATSRHIERLQKFGLCPIHRKTFCRALLDPQETDTQQKLDLGFVA